LSVTSGCVAVLLDQRVADLNVADVGTQLLTLRLDEVFDVLLLVVAMWYRQTARVTDGRVAGLAVHHGRTVSVTNATHRRRLMSCYPTQSDNHWRQSAETQERAPTWTKCRATAICCRPIIIVHAM